MPITIHDISVTHAAVTHAVRDCGEVVAFTRSEADAGRVQLALLRAKPQVTVSEAVRWHTSGPIQAMLEFRTRTGADITHARQAFAAVGLHLGEVR